MLHASYSYPSEIVPLLELGFAALTALLALSRPQAVDPLLRRGWRRLAALSPRRAVAASAAAALAGSLASFAALGWPVPRVSDEFGYLLIGDTLAHARLANPPPRVPAAFEAIHLLVQPGYAAKYPPAQGVALAIGERLGHPGLGVALSVASLAAAACWFLQAWLPPPWPLLGAALLTLRVGIDSYWGQSYWGGALAALGAMLLYGALPRLLPRRGLPRRWPWLAIAGGLALLANSRPVEGLVAAAPAAVVVAIAVAAQRREAMRSLVGPLAVSLGLVAGWMALYDWRVTGDPLCLPYQLYHQRYGVDDPIPFAAPPAAVAYSSPVLAAHLGKRYLRPTRWTTVSSLALGHLARTAWFVCGVPLLVAAVVTLRRPGGWKAFALGCIILQAAVHAVTTWWFPHYSAAATGPLLLLGVWGLRELAGLRVRGVRLGAWVAASALVAQLGVTLVELPAHRPDADDWSRTRERLARRLARQPVASLVVVDDRLRTVDEWVYNEADLDHARVLWIQDLGAATTARVAAAYAPRRAYRLAADERGAGARLQPYPSQ